MKKLMVAIAAVATAFGLYADGQALNEAFVANNETSGQFTPAAPGWATYTGDATKLIITEDTPKMLDISTGTAALKRNVADDGAAWVLDPENNKNLYFDTTIDFKGQVLDDVPDVTGGKLAIFALDGTEINGLPDGTNVYVYAGYGTDSKALYLLSGFDAAFPTEGVNRRIVVKTWANVFSTGTRSGFILYIQNGAAKTELADADIAKVDMAYTYDTTQSKWTQIDISEDGAYLGGAAASVDGTYGKWVAQQSLFLNLDSVAVTTEKFTTLDFQGNAKIAGVNITDVAPVTFPADSFSMDVENDITFTISPKTVTLVNGKLVSPVNGQSVTITPEAKDILVVKVGAQEIANVGGTFTFNFTDGGKLSVHGADKKATVTINETDYPCESIAEAIAKVTEAGVAAKITLNENVEQDYLEFNSQNEITLDLAGKTITLTGFYASLSNSGLLTIIDSFDPQVGKVLCPVSNSGTLNIAAGIFDGAVSNEGGTILATAGSFLQDTNEKTTIADYITDEYEIAGEESDLYWTVVPAAPKTFKVTAIPAEDGEYTTQYKIDDGDLQAYTDEIEAKIDETVTIVYTAATGYTITAGGTVVVDKDSEVKAVPAPTFEAKAYKLNATAGANTTLDKNPSKETYAYGDEVVLTAALADGDFEWDQIPSGWQPGENDTLTLTYTILDEDVESGNVVATPTAKAKAAPVPTPISGGNTAQKNAYAEWVKGITGAEGKTDAIYADAFALNVTQAEIDAADGDIQKATEKKLGAEITSDMVAALAAGTDVDFAALEAKYPNAEFEFVEATELNPEAGVSGFWRLQAKFKALPEPGPVED